MDDIPAFERQLTTVLDRMGGPEPQFDAMHIVRSAKAPTHTRRFPTMFSATRFVVASAILTLSGGFLLANVRTPPEGDRLPPAAAASANPGPSTTPIDPCTTPILPVSGTILWGGEKAGTRYVSSEIGQHRLGFTYVSTMALSDDRLDGSTTGIADWHESSGAGIAHGTRLIENEGGTWEGPETLMSRRGTSFISVAELVGTGAYEGLSATLFLINDLAGLATDEAVIEGSVFPTDLASCDFAATE